MHLSCCVNMDIILMAYASDRFNMVGMIMCYKYISNFRYTQTVIFKVFFQCSYADSGIYQ